MLYPQLEYKFRTITPHVWETLQKKAAENIAKYGDVTNGVRKHMESIVAGVVPFGYTVEKR